MDVVRGPLADEGLLLVELPRGGAASHEAVVELPGPGELAVGAGQAVVREEKPLRVLGVRPRSDAALGRSADGFSLLCPTIDMISRGGESVASADERAPKLEALDQQSLDLALVLDVLQLAREGSAGEPVKAGAACQVAVAAVAGRRAPDGEAQKRLLQGVATRLGGRHPLHGDLQGPELVLRQAQPASFSKQSSRKFWWSMWWNTTVRANRGP